MQKEGTNDNHDITHPSSYPCEKRHTCFFDMKTFSEDLSNNDNLTNELDALRQRSYSYAFSIQYPPKFVPRPKPKQTQDVPSPMRLNAKSFKEYKKNRMSNFLLETDDLYISCPGDDDIDSSNETTSSTPHPQEIPSQIKTARKVMGQIKCQTTKNASKEYESILKNVQFKNETSEVLKYKQSIKRPTDTKLAVRMRFSFNENASANPRTSEEYFELEGAKEHDGESPFLRKIITPKARSLSILNMLEISSDIKKKFI